MSGRLALTLPESVGMALELGNWQRVEEFEGVGQKMLNCGKWSYGGN